MSRNEQVAALASQLDDIVGPEYTRAILGLLSVIAAQQDYEDHIIAQRVHFQLEGQQ